MLAKDAVWFITGCSSGFGKELAAQLIAKGYNVVATSTRRVDVEHLAEGKADTVLALGLDVTKADQIDAAVKAASERFGRIDVLVNNAGYGYMSAIEEGDESDVARLFDVNVFGVVRLLKAVLPGMRERRRGHIVNLSSIGGIVTYPGVGYYHMAKFAVEGMSGALQKELEPLGIGVTVVEPGPFRTRFRGSGSIKQSPTRLPDYEATAGKSRDGTAAGDGKQAGDPARGAAAIIEAVESDQPPRRLVLGAGALKEFRDYLARTGAELDQWEAVTAATDFPPDKG